uniref:DUF2061 domain-containing protein n=1 Tax=Cyclophora tenuis TaxID=216820 RepID=A0A7S1D6H6_CYCTE|mmetsp:Transcript_25141/g.42834  ORF Transcript_25141/g.42834 Transcript_25141/m.42834 type:complete len:104 (+) Transcript_25141:23-334(+)
MKRNQVNSAAQHDASTEETQAKPLLEETDIESGASNGGPIRETHLRSVLKGVTWRFVASFTTMSIAFIVTGEMKTVLEIGVFDFFAKLAFYYIHERIWSRIRV